MKKRWRSTGADSIEFSIQQTEINKDDSNVGQFKDDTSPHHDGLETGRGNMNFETQSQTT